MALTLGAVAGVQEVAESADGCSPLSLSLVVSLWKWPGGCSKLMLSQQRTSATCPGKSSPDTGTVIQAGFCVSTGLNIL